MAERKPERPKSELRIKLEELKPPVEQLSPEEAEQVQGGRKAGGDQQEYLVITMSDAFISG